MNTDSRITYWLKCQPIQNFGDSLSEALFDALTRKSLFNWMQGRITKDYDVVHLIGSCISDYHVTKDLEYVRGVGGKRIAFWGCGLRNNEPLRSDLMAHCAFLGVRGPLTRDVLGLPNNMAIGDPGLLMPYVYTPTPSKTFADKTICVPHFLEKKSDADLLAMSRCQLILRPNIPSGVESISTFIDALVSAKFILAGALHAAIVAHAYRRPFAYFDSGYIDVPFKWADFAASIAMPCRFAKTVDEGAHIFQLQSSGYKMPPLTDLLSCAPFRPPRPFLRRVAAATSCRSSAVSTSAPLATDTVGHLVAAAIADADFIFSPAADTVARNTHSRHVGHCSTIVDQNGRTVLRLSGGANDAPSNGVTGGYSIRVPDAFERAASGRNIRITVVARAEGGIAGTRFAAAYSTNEVGNSGWRWFDVTPGWSVFEMTYSVPQMQDGRGDFIALLPGIRETPGVEICVVTARVA